MKKYIDLIFGDMNNSANIGTIIHSIASDYNLHVRSYGPNAERLFLGPDRSQWRMRAVPCGWVNPKALLVIGAGAFIEAETLRREVEAIARLDSTIFGRLMIDPDCSIIDNPSGFGNTVSNYAMLAAEDSWFSQFAVPDTEKLIERLDITGNKILLDTFSYKFEHINRSIMCLNIEFLNLKYKIETPNTEIALTNIENFYPEDCGKACYRNLSFLLKDFIDNIEKIYNAPVTLISTGGSMQRVVKTQAYYERVK